MCWDDPAVDWSAADLVAVRSTWDYDGRLPEFLAWAGSVGPTLLNGVDLFAWNTDKSYLVTLGASGLPIVPTLVAEGEEDLPTAIASYDVAVVKPCVGPTAAGWWSSTGRPRSGRPRGAARADRRRPAEPSQMRLSGHNPVAPTR